MTSVACITVLIIVAVMVDVLGLQVIPERAAVLYVNKKYVSNVKLYVKRFSRRSNYIMNFDGTTKHVWANNVSVHFVFYEYLHNEYKRSFVELHYKACDMINQKKYIGLAVANAGIKCPIPAGPLHINNITIPAHDFPNVWPFEKSKVDIKIKLASTQELMFNGEMYVIMKQTIGK